MDWWFYARDEIKNNCVQRYDAAEIQFYLWIYLAVVDGEIINTKIMNPKSAKLIIKASLLLPALKFEN